MKNIIRFLGIIALVAVIGFSIEACSKEDPDTDFRYEPSDDSQGMVITGYIGNNVNVVIPAKIQKLPVVKVGGFSEKKIISVVIPSSVKEIGSNAFYNCSNLTSVTFKGQSVIIGLDAFQSCKNLDNLVFSDGALKPYEYKGPLGPKVYPSQPAVKTFWGIVDHPAIPGWTDSVTEHYYYSPGGYEWNMTTGRIERDFPTLRFHSGAAAFRYCEKLPQETQSKLKKMGFLSDEEMLELVKRAERREL